MHVVVVGLHSRGAPLALRERAAFVCGQGAAALVGERAGVTEALVLSTCNRVELYAVAPREECAAVAGRLVALLAERAQVAPDVLRAHAQVHLGADAVRHLCRVAAGLDSVVLGETQILGQLKRAAAEARVDLALGSVLERALSTALAGARRARARLSSATGPTSIAAAGLRAIGGGAALAGRRVLVLGAGETAVEVMRLLDGAGASRVCLVNRSAERAEALARRHGACWRPWSERAEALAEAEVIVACTSAPQPVVEAAHLAPLPQAVSAGAASAASDERPRVVLDLGVPRNVHQAVGALPDVTVWDVDALGGAITAVVRDVSEAEAEVARWAARFEQWLAARAVVPTIHRLREDAERVREQELARALARLDGLTEREQDVVRALTARLVNKLLHAPVATLATAPESPALAESARLLFGHAPCGGDRRVADRRSDAPRPVPAD